MKQKHLLFGTAYYDEYMPYDRIDTDLSLIKDAGMNVIRIAESTWSTWEPQDNCFDFSHLHRMLNSARKYNLKVIIGTPTYAVPAWLVKKHPDVLAVTKNGPELYGHRQLNDITNPHYRYHAKRIIEHLMEELTDYHDIIIGYQIDNETRSAGAASRETQALFHFWLQKQYPDIETFNQEFGLDYWSNRIQSWDDFPDIRGTINGSLSAAYKRFLRDCITEFFEWQASIIRKYSTEEQFITHNFDYSWIGHSHGIQPEVNQFDAAKHIDIAGVDIYHPTQEALTGAEIAFGGAVGRSLKKKNYLLLETQAQGQPHWLPYPGQLRLQAYSHLSSGANSVMYWHWHSIHNSFESYWKGILSHNLTPNASYHELKNFGKEVLPLEKELIHLKKECQIGIIINNESLTGLDEFPIDSNLSYNDILRWFYDSCYEINAEADLLSVNDDFDAYPLLIAPVLYAVSEDTLRKLRNYVSNGGHLLLGYKSGVADENLKIYQDNQPHLLADVIGATYDQFTVPHDVMLNWDSTKITAKQDSISHWMELVSPTTAQILAGYDHYVWNKYAAVTHNQYGNGTATYLACHTTKAALKDLLKYLMQLANIPISEYQFPCIIKSGINSEGNKISYYFNYSNQPVTVSSPDTICTNLLNSQTIQPDSELSIPAWDLIILKTEA